jgi:hypothetical protein
MPIRILFLLFAFFIFSNLVILILGFVLNQNLYKTQGKLIANMYGIFALIVVIGYFIISFLGLE